MSGKPVVVLAVTGATGAFYAQSFMNRFKSQCFLHVIFSDLGKQVFLQELGTEYEAIKSDPEIKVWDNHALDSPLASGSNYFDCMVVCPCSMKSLAQIRMGFADTLICRVADVALKERRALILGVREAPYNTIHLENMLRISELGGIIFPLSPVFYNSPKTIGEQVDYLVERMGFTARICTKPSNAWKSGELEWQN